MSSRDLHIWEINHLEDCASKNLFKGKNVLEVGGIIPLDHVEQLEVKSWTSIDPAKHYKNYNSENYKIINDSINTYDFEDESFDFVISTNSFEHINGLDIALGRMYKLLKKGGLLSTLFGPIWSCHKGNHIWIYSNGKISTFNDGLVPDWGHLLYTPDELTEILKKEHNDSIVDSIIHSTYETDFINRLFYDDYKNLLFNSGFEVSEFRDWHTSVHPDSKTLKILQEKYSKENFSTVSIKALLRK